jgi:hypothetical protein
LWPGKKYGNAVFIAGVEQDGLFLTEDCIHLVECTTSRNQQKARDDIRKLDRGADLLRKDDSDKGLKTWFITRHDPTADQAKEAKNSASGVTIMPFSAFQAKLVDVALYLECRCQHRFGSIEHPLGQDSGEIPYIEIPILSANGPEEWSVLKLSNSLLVGERFTMLGDYGIGKSMTLREVFRFLRKRYMQQHVAAFPLHLNLREHHGQSDPAEIIERHARNIGYPNPSHLVRAWKAGYAMLLLDGFDEVASFALPGAWKALRQARWQTVAGLRGLIEGSPSKTGIVVAGRHSFFDSDKERHEALKDSAFVELLLHEFTETQISKFFEYVGYKGSIPSWLPARPLLLSTIFWLYAQKSGGSINNLPDDPVAGWGMLVEAIADRESKIEAGVSGTTIRILLERLATKARATGSGLGPLTSADITSAFAEIAGSPPSSEALGVLQRLPGLGAVPNAFDGSRIFLDEDLVDALGAADVAIVLENPYAIENSHEVFAVTKTLGQVGSGILRSRLSSIGFDQKRCIQVVRELERRQKSKGLMGDLLIFALRCFGADNVALTLQDLEFSYFEIVPSMGDMSRVIFESCIFRLLSIETASRRESLPIFNECLMESLEGFLSKSDLPQDRFKACEIEHFADGAETNTAITNSDLPAQIRVLVTILRKLFVQSLSGRQVSALRRGIDLQSQRYVDDILKTLIRHNLATKYGGDSEVIIPVRRQRHRATAIIASPLGCKDPVVQDVKESG